MALSRSNWGGNWGDNWGWPNRDFGLTRYSPWNDFGLNTWGGLGDVGGGALTTGFRPSVDVRDTGNEIVVHTELPGVPKENVNIEIRDNNLWISGNTSEENERREWNGWIRERRSGRFTRSIPLPTSIDTEKVQAKFDQGVLEIIVPRTETEKKTITIQ
ncbi:8441_t:CDS:2 [Ambispora leptoticha]|uniref:8441_t:CDS:1 n=1 Tax=Ambispora leptoticha TaxID=144679 RepID=A0A9N9DZR1_9GLOM|nr:8441_t:CDS:2 [Ambispora leptoticha]